MVRACVLSLVLLAFPVLAAEADPPAAEADKALAAELRKLLDTKEINILYFQAVRKHKWYRTAPVAYKADLLSAKTLAPYGEVRSIKGEPEKLAPEGKDLLLVLDVETPFSKLIEVAKNPKTGAFPQLGIVCRGPAEIDVILILRLPQIGDGKADQGKEDLDALVLRVAGAKPSGEDWSFQIRNWQNKDPNKLAATLMGISHATADPGKVHVRIAPEEDACVATVCAAVDACLLAGLTNVVLVPPEAKKKE